MLAAFFRLIFVLSLKPQLTLQGILKHPCCSSELVLFRLWAKSVFGELAQLEYYQRLALQDPLFSVVRVDLRESWPKNGAGGVYPLTAETTAWNLKSCARPFPVAVVLGRKLAVALIVCCRVLGPIPMIILLLGVPLVHWWGAHSSKDHTSP